MVRERERLSMVHREGGGRPPLARRQNPNGVDLGLSLPSPTRERGKERKGDLLMDESRIGASAHSNGGGMYCAGGGRFGGWGALSKHRETKRPPIPQQKQNHHSPTISNIIVELRR